MQHVANLLIKRLEDEGMVIRRVKKHGSHLVARNPKNGATATIGLKCLDRVGFEKSYRMNMKLLLKSAA